MIVEYSLARNLVYCCLKDSHYLNVWNHAFMFNEVDCPLLGKKRPKGSGERYKKRFCLCCMVSFSNEVLHVCQGKCPKCLGNFKNHMLSVHGSCADLILCDACGRKFNNNYCFETHRSNVLEGEFKSFCNFLSS